MNRIQLSDLPWEEVASPTKKFHSFFRNVSLALGGIRNTGTWGGGHPFDLQIRRLPPGAAVCPYHLHLAQWEFFLVLAGAGTVRTAEGHTDVATGDVFFQPPGTAHQLTNTGSGDLEVLIITDNPPLDAFHYPDSNKWGLRPPGKIFRIAEVDYFDGEDAAPAGGASPYKIAPAPAAPPATAFARRLIKSDALPWDSWSSPKGKFRGHGKELSIALGAKRNTPTGLGGHPFDVELDRLAPGEAPCPFHSHSAQWELYYVLSGTANLRTAEQTQQLRAGDVAICPPGEAHQIANASATDELQFYLVADNPPVDYWFYPDSNKWGLRDPRKFFRGPELDYWDGEE